MTRTATWAALCLVLLACGCVDEPAAGDLPRELEPVPNPFGPDHALWAPQPHRDRPSAIAAGSEGTRLFVTLEGTEADPGREVAVVDAATLESLGRIEVGPAPHHLALHPGGRHLVVLNRFARYASVIDVRQDRVIAEVPTPYYTEHIAFSPDGTRAYLANRWKDSVLRWDVSTDGGFEVIPRDPLEEVDLPIGLPVDPNPDRLVVTPDGLLVGSETAMSLVLLDPVSGAERARYEPNAPVTDFAVVGDYVVVLHTGSGAGHPPDTGFDGDEDGVPGDGTANVTFQDLQNEIDVLRLGDLSRVERHTSDTICCRDYRDVNPDDPHAGEGLAPRDAWPAERVDHLLPAERWTVAGAMPERVVPIRRPDGAPAVAVVFGGSSEVQTFDLDPVTGELSAKETADTGLYSTGLGATDAVALDGGRRLVVVDRLGETLTALDLEAGPEAPVQRGVVGDVSGGPFPSTDVELGEAFNTVTAPFTVDGDQTCVHCHRDGSPVAKPVSMPLLDQPEWGVRLVMSYRRAFDSRPWFVEAAMDEENFFPVINEFARKENFCCEQRDPRIWSRYPTVEQCRADEALEGCNHVLGCTEDPPPECLADPRGLPLTRDRHFREAARRIFGREESFGDSLFVERVGPDGGLERRPVSLGFDGITRALGVFLLARPRALPNPNAVRPTARARLGEVLFRSTGTGCAECHPLPVTATARGGSGDDATAPLTFPYVVSPVRHPETGADVDRTSPAFLGTFPQARQTDGGLRVGVTQLRGIWDRTRFLHHGQARSLREALATPGHAGLGQGERGFNERNGQPNTHGGTSHLTSDELAALVAYLETL